MEEKLQKIIKKAKKPIALEKIYEKMEVSTESEKALVKDLLDRKIKDYSIIQAPNGNYISITKTSFRKGPFYSDRNGDGQVIVASTYLDKDGSRKMFEDKYVISKGSTGGAINGDIVLIEFVNKNKSGRKIGVVQKVIERNLDTIMGEVCRIGTGYFVKPIDKKKQNLVISLEGEAIEGQRVAVFLEKKMNDNFYIGKIKRTFNHKDDPDEDILWEAFKLGIESDFSRESLDQVKNIPQTVEKADLIGRMNLTDWEIFTIDGEDTKDIDDALSCKRLSNGNYLVGVHIADVSHYVLEDSPLDMDAYKRGTSAYLSGKVIPMLPHELSNGICSLNPNADRLALSCVMEVDPNGNICHYDIWKSVIKSQLKMSYTKVNNILKNGEIPSEYAIHTQTLNDLNDLALILRKNRIAKGAIEFDRPELKVKLDDNGRCSGFSVRKQDLGENLIEEFMLLANETVDKHLSSLGVPCLHRIHDTPNRERLEEFIRLLNMVGYTYDKYDADACISNPKALQDLAEYIKDTGSLANMLSTNMVKCMSRAKYSPINIGHSGLGKTNYCHFTSPIRRYPDLIIHRLLKDFCLDKHNVENDIEKWENKLPEIAIQSSKMERLADEAEMQILNMRCAEYMSKRVGEDFDGTIIGLSSDGILVQLDNYIEGRVRLRNLVGEYVYDPNTYTLYSLDSRGNYYIGDRLSLKVKSADKENKTIDFTINNKINENKLHHLDNGDYHAKTKTKTSNKRNGYY